MILECDKPLRNAAGHHLIRGCVRDPLFVAAVPVTDACRGNFGVVPGHDLAVAPGSCIGVVGAASFDVSIVNDNELVVMNCAVRDYPNRYVSIGQQVERSI